MQSSNGGKDSNKNSSLTHYVRRSDILETKPVAGGSSSSGLDEKLSGKVELST